VLKIGNKPLFFAIFVLMKKTSSGIAILLSIVFLYNAVLSGYYFSYYLLSKGGFVAAYCQNKARPQLHCQGACKFVQLTKEQTNAPISQEKVFILLEVFFQELPQWELADFPTLVTHCYYYTSFFEQEVHFPQLHPPLL
jgi:hypothetical protein